MADWKDMAALALACAALIAAAEVLPVPEAVADDVKPPLVLLAIVLMPVDIVAASIGISPPYSAPGQKLSVGRDTMDLFFALPISAHDIVATRACS